MLRLLRDASALRAHILRVLDEKSSVEDLFPKGIRSSAATSAVLLLLGQQCDSSGPSTKPCLIFNKRSIEVKQPGDLCFPGGRITPRPDGYLSRILTWPFFPLARWPYWNKWRHLRPVEARRLALLLAAGLREGLEEMRLNPLGVTFLGPLPRQRLQMFDRIIYPMASWIGRQKRFFPNWEVEKIVYMPLRDLLNADGYRCYRLRMGPRQSHRKNVPTQDFPCFVYGIETDREVLWGATYRITTLFLKLIFGFAPPPMETLPVIEGALNDHYLTGSGRPDPD
ncbi:MAG: hypothetical protein JRL30_02895 [Deltaproteobacteria bacterium]|nr:hypothetical protein [Deltaproteobacteria bacterium]